MLKYLLELQLQNFGRNTKMQGMKECYLKWHFFAASIAELQNELKPLVEEVLAELDIPLNKILVNVGDPKNHYK